MSESEFQRTIHEVNHARSVRLFAAECTLAAIRAALEVKPPSCLFHPIYVRGCPTCDPGFVIQAERARLLAILDGNQAPSATTPGSKEADDA